MSEEHEGASHNERLLSAARSDNEDLLLEVFEHPDRFDINFRDGCVHSHPALISRPKPIPFLLFEPIDWETQVCPYPLIPHPNTSYGHIKPALHYAAQHGSTTVLEHLLSFEGCDVDLQNRLERDTPLHAAVKNLDDPEQRNYVMESLLEAGANTKIKDKNGDIVLDLVSSSSRSLDDELRSAIRKAEAEASVSQADIADDDDDGDESGSASDE